jgi:hypothetical protein
MRYSDTTLRLRAARRIATLGWIGAALAPSGPDPSDVRLEDATNV